MCIRDRFKTGEMGNPTANQDQAELGDAAREIVERVRYDFLTPVSYTHLDVYKRQSESCILRK